MSLAHPDDEYDDLIDESPRKRRGNAKINKLLEKSKFILIILIIGIIIGVIFGHIYVEPIFTEGETSSCKTCLESKDLLSKENSCLYEQVQDQQLAINQCSSFDN